MATRVVKREGEEAHVVLSRGQVEAYKVDIPAEELPKAMFAPVYYGSGEKKYAAAGRKAVISVSDPTVWHTVNASEDYKLVQHSELAEAFEEAISRVPEFGKPAVVTRLPYNGGRMVREYFFPDIEVEIEGKDFVCPRVSLTNGHDKWVAVGMIFGAFRLVCSNGLTVGKQFAKSAHKHVQTLNIGDMAGDLQVCLNVFSQQTELYKQWVSQLLNEEQAKKRVMAVLGTRGQEAVMEELEVQQKRLRAQKKKALLTTWFVYNVLTQYISHNIKSTQRRLVYEERLQSQF